MSLKLSLGPCLHGFSVSQLQLHLCQDRTKKKTFESDVWLRNKDLPEPKFNKPNKKNVATATVFKYIFSDFQFVHKIILNKKFRSIKDRQLNETRLLDITLDLTQF